MSSLSRWLPRHAASEPVPGSAPLPQSTYYPRPRDPNAPDYRLQLTSKCIYERQLPGGSYMTAHVERLQSGFYDSPVIHEDCIGNVRFVAIRFVFHEASTERRFKSATIRISLHDETVQPEGIPLPPQIEHPSNNDPVTEKPRMKPKFLRHAPHLLYGAMSPETLDWNFNLAGSLGVAQTPVSASINPSGGVKSSYKVFKMMKIQGSCRTNSSWFGKHYDVEDGELVWTLEENELQKSGLPREFTFVMMLTKGDDANNVKFEIDIQPEVAAWFGHWPQWWVHTLRYQPLHKEFLDLDKDLGQRFEPCDSHRGFNFANLMSTFDNFVTLPGTLYSTNDWSSSQGTTAASKDSANQGNQKQQNQGQLTQSPAPVDNGDQPKPNNTLHLRIHVDQPQKQTLSTSQTYPYPDFAPRTRKSPPSHNTPSPKPDPSKPQPSHKRSNSTPSRPERRITLSSMIPDTPPKYKTARVTPLQTHYEEQQYHSPPRVKSSSHEEQQQQHHSPPLAKSSSEEETDNDYEFAFPESIDRAPKAPYQPNTSLSYHRHSKSNSTSSSTAMVGSHSAPAITTKATAHTPLSSHPSLRRTRSRSGLRRASLHSEPEDEEAIAAAMDMLSGSPPLPAPAPPASAPAVLYPQDDMILATPRTRAALADLIEVEQAESARVERRNGNLNTEMNKPPPLPPQLGSRTLTSRSRDREKRYSLPVTSTGIGYSGSFPRDENPRIERTSHSHSVKGKERDSSAVMGNGRSSLMIPVASRRDGTGANGLGIGIATTPADPVGNHRSSSSSAAVQAR